MPTGLHSPASEDAGVPPASGGRSRLQGYSQGVTDTVDGHWGGGPPGAPFPPQFELHGGSRPPGPAWITSAQVHAPRLPRPGVRPHAAAEGAAPLGGWFLGLGAGRGVDS